MGEVEPRGHGVTFENLGNEKKKRWVFLTEVAHIWFELLRVFLPVGWTGQGGGALFYPNPLLRLPDCTKGRSCKWRRTRHTARGRLRPSCLDRCVRSST